MAQGGIVTIHHDWDNADRRELTSLSAKGLEWLACEHRVERVGMTYRKRAYARLGISSQNELMRILM